MQNSLVCVRGKNVTRVDPRRSEHGPCRTPQQGHTTSIGYCKPTEGFVGNHEPIIVTMDIRTNSSAGRGHGGISYCANYNSCDITQGGGVGSILEALRIPNAIFSCERNDSSGPCFVWGKASIDASHTAWALYPIWTRQTATIAVVGAHLSTASFFRRTF